MSISQSLRFMIMDLLILTLLHSYTKYFPCNPSVYYRLISIFSCYTINNSLNQKSLDTYWLNSFTSISNVSSHQPRLILSDYTGNATMLNVQSDSVIYPWFELISFAQPFGSLKMLTQFSDSGWICCYTVLCKSVINFRLHAGFWKVALSRRPSSR